MLKEERHRYIIDRINRDNRIYVTELSEELKVSDDTLRRDLVELENSGLLTKVHGGAVAKSGISIRFSDRLNTSTSVKQAMAAKLVPLFEEGDVILIDGGTTNLEVARQLPKDKCFTVYTNCLPIAIELSGNPKVDLTLLGGKVFPPSQVTVGVPVFQMIQSVYPDWVIVGVSDLHPQKRADDIRPRRSHHKALHVEAGRQKGGACNGRKAEYGEELSCRFACRNGLHRHGG